MARVSEFEVELETPVEASVNGQMEECETVLLVAPKGKHSKICNSIAGINGYVQKKLAEMHSGSENKQEPNSQVQEENDKVESSTVKLMFMMAIGDNEELVDRLSNLTRKLITGGCCKIGGKDINDKIIDDRMDVRDYDKIVWEYLANFLLTS